MERAGDIFEVASYITQSRMVIPRMYFGSSRVSTF